LFYRICLFRSRQILRWRTVGTKNMRSNMHNWQACGRNSRNTSACDSLTVLADWRHFRPTLTAPRRHVRALCGVILKLYCISHSNQMRRKILLNLPNLLQTHNHVFIGQESIYVIKNGSMARLLLSEILRSTIKKTKKSICCLFV